MNTQLDLIRLAELRSVRDGKLLVNRPPSQIMELILYKKKEIMELMTGGQSGFGLWLAVLICKKGQKWSKLSTKGDKNLHDNNNSAIPSINGN